MNKIPAFLCAAAIGIVSLFSCKKDTDSNSTPPPIDQKNDTLSKRFIPGWWTPGSSYNRLYFGVDSFFYGVISYDQSEQTGKWWWQGDDTLKIATLGWPDMAQDAQSVVSWPVKRLTADSVYIDIGNRTVIPCVKKDSTVFTSPVLITLAGIDRPTFSGDNGPATKAALYNPADVAVDNVGNLLIADWGNELVRKITASSGVISIAAGIYSSSGQPGDGLPATGTQIWAPSGVAFDKAGNYYYADMVQNVVRKVTVSTGLMNIIAGDGDGISGTFGYNGDNIPARQAKLRGPSKVALDKDGNVYFGDAGNYRVRRVDHTTGIITTVAGNGTQGFNGDGITAITASLNNVNGVAFDKYGNLFIADKSRIRRVDVITGLISTVAGTGTTGYSGDGGAAKAAQLSNVVGVTVDDAGNIFFCDTDNNRVRKVSATDGTISTIAGSAIAGYSGNGMHATAMRLNQPMGIAVDATGNVYFADYKNSRVRKLIINK
ncbi:hypothetical protein A4H97_08465 [Niastella yeongjuensis]|uniref:Teneurin NHL domain-containing protein n=1 Tax=Niastella yeongjuensis TaxID=354355 RepID=A0A1V9EN48_9BACT|nr:hypothetical protein [Niastella yeongjuensis]OQP47511.1 hypothetical protein A4H97_08465 [Niastella yeongjuensis]SEN87331.1 NHL repeat [Niastella yeongjuensis]